MRACVTVLLLALAGLLPARASTFSETFVSAAPPRVPNLIRFFLTPGGNTSFTSTPPTFFLSNGGSWTYTALNGGFNAQLSTSTPLGALNGAGTPLAWSIEFSQGAGATQFSISWQEYQGATPTASHSQTFNGPVVNGAAPEPAASLVLGLGAVALLVLARRRTAPAIAA
jgi:hypothetical protein